MKNHSRNNLFTPLHKNFFRYVSFSLLSMVGMSFYIIVDTLFIANGVGKDGLAALNIVIPAYNIVNGIGILFGIGGATLFSISQARKQKNKSAEYFTLTLLLSLIVGVLLILGGRVFPTQLVKLLGGHGPLVPLATISLKTLLSFSPFFILSQVMMSFLRNDDNPQLAMIAMVTGNLLNVGLDYLFIYSFGWGMFGAAFASGLSPTVSTLLTFLHFLRKDQQLYFHKPKKIIFSTKKILSLGFPASFTDFSSGLVIFLFNSLLYTLSGNTSIAAYGIIANLSLIAAALFTGIGQGIQPLLSRAFTKHNKPDSAFLIQASLLLSLGLGLIFYLSGIVFTDSLIVLFNIEKDLQLHAIAQRGIELYFLAFPVMGLNIVAIAIFSATAKPRHAFFLSLVRGLIAIIPIILIFSWLWEIEGVWLTIPATELFTFFFTAVFLFSAIHSKH